MFNVFKVGDIITGLPINGYGHTNEHTTMQVMDVTSLTTKMIVKIIDSQNPLNRAQIGRMHIVANTDEKFVLITRLESIVYHTPTDMLEPLQFGQPPVITEEDLIDAAPIVVYPPIPTSATVTYTTDYRYGKTFKFNGGF